MAQISREISDRLTNAFSKIPDINFKMILEHDNPSLGLKATDPLVSVLKKVLKLNKLPVILSAKPACTEAGLYAEWGVSTVVVGPGEAIGNIHAPNESLELDQLEKAVTLYQSIIKSLCIQHERS